jgi:hypothetical protein
MNTSFGTASHQVDKANTTTTPTSLPNPSIFGQSVTFTATVTSTQGIPTGSVTFKDGVTTIGSGTLSNGVATFSTSSLSGGSRSITAVYGGDTNFNTSTSAPLTQVVNKADTTTTLVSSSSTTVFGQSLTFTATVTSTQGTPTGTVTFKEGATTIGTGSLSSGQATLTISTLSASPHSITAEYGGSGNYNPSTSNPLSQTVNKANTTTTITADLPDPSRVGENYVVSFSVTANSPGSGTPTGNVTVNDGEGHTCTATVAVGSCALPSIGEGAKTLTANYIGDGNFNGGTSAGVPHQVTGMVFFYYFPIIKR